MNNRHFLFLIVLILWAGYAFGQNVKTLRYDKEKISLEYPTEWVVRNFEPYPVLVSEPPEKEITVMSTFDIAFDYVTPNLAEFCKKYEEKMAKGETYKNFKVESKTKITYKGYDAYEYHCTATYQSISLEWKSIILLKDGKVFKLTTTSSTQKYVGNKAKTDKIFESVKFE